MYLKLNIILFLSVFLTSLNGLPIGEKRDVVTVYKTAHYTKTVEAGSKNTEKAEVDVGTQKGQYSSVTLLSSTATTISNTSSKTATPASTTASTFAESSSDLSTIASKSTEYSTNSHASSSSLPKSKTFPTGAFQLTVDKVWARFWLQDKSAWNNDDSICGKGTYLEPVVWNQAVIGKAVTNSRDTERIKLVINNINNYKNNNLGVFSASTSGDEDIYNDDNAQLAWVFTEAYRATSNSEYLKMAEDVVSFLMKQWDSGGKGGVFWKYKADYISSISTVESALAAMRLYTITSDKQLLSFSEKCMDFMFEYFQASDKLFFDGFDIKNPEDMNKGKLSYTVGCALSTLAYLNNYSSKTHWKTKAIELGEAAMNQNGALYDGNKIWNNQLQYVHLLYAGYADLLTITEWEQEYTDFKLELIRQGNLMVDFRQDPADKSLYFNLVTSSTQKLFDNYEATFQENIEYRTDSSIYCDGDTDKPTRKSLMDNASAAQILYEIIRIL